MPPSMKWRADGTSASPKPIDVRLDRLGGDDRLQVPSGVTVRTVYRLYVNAIREAWALGGIWAEAVRALKTRRITVAAFFEAKQRGEVGIKDLLARAGSEPLKDLIRDYLKQTKATDTARMKQRLERFAKSLGEKPSVADVTADAVEAFLDALTDQRTTPKAKNPKRKDKRWPARKEAVAAKGSTQNRYRAVISGLSTWAIKKGRMTTHPIAGKQVEKRQEPHHRLPEMTADAYRGYMASAREKRPDVTAVLVLLIHTGCDVGEYETLAARDVDFERGRIWFDRPKTLRYGSKPRFVPMPSVLTTELRAHIAEHGVQGEDMVFGMFPRSDVEWLHKQARAAIARPSLTLKDLRHVAAIAWVTAGVHIRLVMRWLGHRSLSQTMKYTDYEPDAAEAVAQAERAAETLNRTHDVTPIRKAQ